MNIVFLLRLWPIYGGGETVTICLANEMAKRGHAVTVFYFKDSETNELPYIDDIHRMCSDAYTKGRMVERSLAIEAYRLRCSNLFGNRCMSRTIFGALSKKTCDGNCWYLNQFKLELYKLET